MRPTEIFGDVKGMIRDVAVDAMPDGFVYDMTDYIPNRKGSRVDIRGNWSFLGPAFPGTIYGGRDCRFASMNPSDHLLVCSGSRIWDIHHDTGAVLQNVGAGPAVMVQNAEKLRDRAYFFDGQGINVPTAVTSYGGALATQQLPGSAPKSKVGIVYKDRLVLADGADARFSPLPTAGSGNDTGPMAAWDTTSKVGTSETINGFAAMQGQILVFHTAMIERIRGTIAPATNVVGNMSVDTLSDQVGCTLPSTIVPWRENIIWADERGVYLTDGTSVRSLTEQGGVSDFWREAYRYRFQGASINCSVYMDFLLISILTTQASKPFFVCCDLNERTWFRFTNFAASCQIPGEGSREEIYTGMYTDNKLAIVSSMFGEPYIGINPAPDLADGNGNLVLPSITTGFKKLGEEGMQRIREIHLSYHHQSYTTSAGDPNAVKLEYRLSPPTPLEFDIVNLSDWKLAGAFPSNTSYSRKKAQVGKRAYGLMVRVTALKGSRVSRLFSIGVKGQAQDRGKVTS